MLGVFYRRSGVFVQGSTGDGKTKLIVLIIRGYLMQGRRVATNIELFPEKMRLPGYDKNPEKYHKLIIRLPNKVKARHLKALGLGHDGDVLNKAKYGLIAIDEMLTHYDNHSYKCADNKPLRDWLTQSRHFRWNVTFISQNTMSLDKQLILRFCNFNVSVSLFDLFGLLPEIYIATFAKRNRKGANAQEVKFRSFWFSIYCSRAAGLFQSILFRKAPSVEPMYDTEQDLVEDIPSQVPYYVLTGEEVKETTAKPDGETTKKKYRLKLSDISFKKLIFSPNAFMLIPIIGVIWLTVWGFQQSYQNFFVDDVKADVDVVGVPQSGGCLNTSDFFQLALTYPDLNATIESDLLLNIMRDYIPVLSNVIINGDFIKFDVNWYHGKKLVDSTGSVELEYYGWLSKVIQGIGILLSRKTVTLFIPFDSSDDPFLNSYNPLLKACGAPVYRKQPMEFRVFFQYHWYTPKSGASFLLEYLQVYRSSLSSVSFNDFILNTYTLTFSDGSGNLITTLSHFQLEQSGYVAYVWHGGLVFQYGKQLIFIRINQKNTHGGFVKI